MIEFQNIVDAIHDLSQEDKLKLRSWLDNELKSPSVQPMNGVKSASGLIGLFADEPELVDQIMESAYEHRNQPLRVDE